MHRLLILLLLAGPAFAGEGPQTEGGDARCPSAASGDGGDVGAAVELRPSAAPALQPAQAATGAVPERPKPRLKPPAWQSYLPGMFK